MPEPHDPINPNQSHAPGSNPTDVDPKRETNEFVKNDANDLSRASLSEEEKERDTSEKDFEKFNVDKVEKLEEEKNEEAKEE
jgi:hypothetical protein